MRTFLSKIIQSNSVLPYMVNSVVATAADFSVFHIGLTQLGCEAVWATFLGNCVGAVLSFFMLRFWVFADAAPASLKLRMAKFAVGVCLIMLTNAVLVAFFHHICIFPAWPSRIGAAIGAWLVGFLFNRHIVFEKS